jgi:hypothetical protein
MKTESKRALRSSDDADARYYCTKDTGQIANREKLLASPLKAPVHAFF